MSHYQVKFQEGAEVWLHALRRMASEVTGTVMIMTIVSSNVKKESLESHFNCSEPKNVNSKLM